MGLIKADYGKLKFLNSNLRFSEISFSSEKMDFFPDLTCNDFFYTIKEIHSIPKYSFEKKVKSLSKIFELEKFLNIKLKNFSQGMLKKASFIACLLNEPKFILLDEPFSGLDQDARIILKNEINKFKRKGGGVLLTSHMFDDVSPMIDDWFYIKKGKIIDSSFEVSNSIRSDFDLYNIEVLVPKEEIEFTKNEVSRNLNRYNFNIPENEKEVFIKEVISKGCHVESVISNKLKLSDHFLTLEDR